MTPERIGSYPIEREIGRGGMGVVYLGRDLRLDRRVAIKVLPEAFAHDPERLARFEREARLVASLNHPNIAGIYGLEGEGEQRFLALEYVEGDTLAERIARGALSLDDTLEVCRQVAAALEAAHEGGVVHRDLKPGNIKVTPAGAVKVLDFGLAKGGAGTGSESASDLSHSPTMTAAATGVGVILGTAAYMSPEQARGKVVDRRTDIWSFGCVLFECLTGRQAFSGETVSDIVARILQGEPEWNAVPSRTPERVRGLLRRCLEKDAKRRLRDIGDARVEIEDVQTVRSSSSSVAAAAAGSRSRLEWARLAGVAVLAVAATWLATRALDRPTRAPASRFEIVQPEGVFLPQDGVSQAISPDGRTVAFVAYDSAGDGRVWVRKLESTVARPIPGTNGSDLWVAWSPDGRQVAFSAQSKLKHVALTGGDPEVVCPIGAMRGCSWGRNGVMLIAPTSNGPIYRVPASGGEPQPVTTLDSARGETGHRFPQFLPDGRHFLFTALPAQAGKFDTYVGSLDSPKRKLVMSVPSGVTWAPPGHLLFARGGKLMAQAFDPKAMRLRGEPGPLGDGVTGTNHSGGPIVSASASGALVYATLQPPNYRLAWVEPRGREIASIPLAPGPYISGTLSPDDRRAVLQRSEGLNSDELWIADLERGVATRFTDEPGDNEGPQWSPDGTRIAYMWSDNAPQRFKVKSLVGDTVTTFLEADPYFKRFAGWTRDGRSLLYSRLTPKTQWDMWVLPLDGDRQPRPILQTRYNESEPAVSPDGRWITYNSDESGKPEAYVQSYPILGGKYQVTTGGGQAFGWSPDGKQLYFAKSSDTRNGYAADVLAGSEFRLGPHRIMFTPPENSPGAIYALDHAGKRVLITLPAGKPPTPTLTVLLNPEYPR